VTGPWNKEAQVEAALALWRQGINILAAPERQKAPAGSWKRWQQERMTERFVIDSFSHGPRNYFAVLGVVSGFLVLDTDSETGELFWRQAGIGDLMDQTACARTGKGYHFWWRLPEDCVAAKSSKGDGWDLQGDGKGVICPPSIHPSGKPYVWIRPLENALPAPGVLLDAPGGSRGVGPGAASKGHEGPKSTLVGLLSAPPGEGGRNDWLTRVAGHYATRFREEDLYEHHVRWAAGLLPAPLPEEEVAKTLDSIWSTERAKIGDIPEQDSDWRITTPSVATGWLVSGGNRLLVTAKTGDDGVELQQWADADFRAVGIMRTEEEQIYDVEVRGSDGRIRTALLPSSVLGSTLKLSVWLAGHGVKQISPDRMSPRGGSVGPRIQAYLDAQDPPTFEAVPHLGWHEGSGSFLTHEGVIRAEGPGPWEDVKPMVGRDRADYHYGFGGRGTARDILAEVLTFHEPEVTAVFGSWWAAVFLKPQLMAALSQFPFMAIEAPSESGKSTGFFQLLLELGGARDSNMQSTKAATRDFLTAHANGVVWSDDLDDPLAQGELIRGSTTGTTITKKGIDHTSQVKAVLRAALVLSGEALGLGTQKALMDRAVMLEVPSPKGRMSLHDPSRPQWDDIVALRAAYPDLTAYAGEYVQQALGAAEGVLRDVKKLRPGSGRWADKIAVVRAGARLLAQMSGVDEVVDRVDAWAGEQLDTGAENTLTLRVLPVILRSIGRKDRPEGPDPQRGQTATPVLVREEEVWFSPTLCADWWHLRFRNGVNFRTETAEALTQQAKALGLGGQKHVDRKPIRYMDNSGRSSYWRCPPDLTREILTRADEVGVRDPEEEEQMGMET
jgi:hypothetical protein